MKTMLKNPRRAGTIPPSLTLFLLIIFLLAFVSRLAPYVMG
jgi:hypothetical protein